MTTTARRRDGGLALGLDLGSSAWTRNGSALVAWGAGRFTAVEPSAVRWPARPLTPVALADTVLSTARERGARAIAIDGPHAWRDPRRPDAFVGRACERATRTPGKTGPPNVAVPRTWLGWTRFSIETFAALLEHADVTLAGDEGEGDGEIVLAECFPTSTWRAAGLAPLPGAARCDAATLHARARDLWARFALPGAPPEALGHDDLQAVVAALVGAALSGGPCAPAVHGEPLRVLEGPGPLALRRVEGRIWDAVPARVTS